MVLCLIVGCSKRSGRDKDVSFYRVPKVITSKGRGIEELSRRRREGYIAAISRSDLSDSILENDRICSRHFISGKPAQLEDELNPDWLPTQHLGHSHLVSSRARPDGDNRYQRTVARRIRSETMEAAQTLLDLTTSTYHPTTEVNDMEEAMETTSTGVQTDLTRADNLLFHSELHQAQEKIKQLEEQLKSTSQLNFTESFVLCDPESEANKRFVQFYTGLPNAQILKAVFQFTALTRSNKITKLTHFQVFMMTLMKLRLNPPMQDLAFRFGVSCSTVFRIIHKWLTLLDARLRPLILWPE